MNYARVICSYVFAGLSIALLLTSVGFSQASATGDSAAFTVVRLYLTNTIGQSQVQSFRASGSALHISGGTQSNANIQLESFGPLQSRVDIVSPSGHRLEIRGFDVNGLPSGTWSNSANSHPVSLPNLYQETNWFFPALSALGQTSDPLLNFELVGQEEWNGTNVTHVRVTRILGSRSAAFPVPTFATDYYLDPSSGMLLGMRCVLHPDDSASVDVIREVRYSQYANISGINVATQVDRYLNGTLELSITLSSVEVNPTLAQSDFQPY